MIHLHSEHLAELAAPFKHVIVAPLAQGEEPERVYRTQKKRTQRAHIGRPVALSAREKLVYSWRVSVPDAWWQLSAFTKSMPHVASVRASSSKCA